MNSIEQQPQIPIFTFIGGGTTGETAAGFLEAVNAGLIPGINEAEVNAVVGSADNGSRSGDLSKRYRLHSPGDFRRSISALSANTYAAPVFERRFCEADTPDDVFAAGEELLAALSYSDTPVTGARAKEIVGNAYILSHDIMEHEDKKLKGVSIGHLVVASLMIEHRLEGKGKNVQTALDEAAAFMAVRGRVIADSLVPHNLEMLDAAEHIYGEEAIDNHEIQHPDNIKVWVSPAEPFSSVPANPAALDAITRASRVFSGPGSLYTSNIAPLLVDGLSECMVNAEAEGKPFTIIANLLMDNTETRSMTGKQYVTQIEKYAGRTCSQFVYNTNTASLPENEAFTFDREELSQMGDFEVIAADLVGETEVVYDPNNPLTNRTKAKHRMAAAAVASLAPAAKKEPAGV